MANDLTQIKKEDWENLTFQIGISKNQQHGGRRFMPYAQATKAAYIIYFLMLHIENTDYKLLEQDKTIKQIIIALNNLIEKPPKTKQIGFGTN